MSLDPSSVVSTDDNFDVVVLKPLSPEEEARLWRSVALGDESAKQELVLSYRPFARRLAASAYSKRYGVSLEFEDFFQYALIGLVEAVERYDPARGASFATFAGYRIKGAILNGVETLTEQQQQIQARKRVLAERANTLKDETKQTNNLDTLFAELADVAIGLAIGCILEGSGLYRAREDEEAPESLYSRYELKQLREHIARLVDTLPEREGLIVKLHYFHGTKFEDIAQELGLSKGRISQLHRSALAALRTRYERAEGIDKRF